MTEGTVGSGSPRCGAGAGVLQAGQGTRGVASARPPGAASRHTRAGVPAAALGAGPHLQARDQGLERARRTAQTCPAGRRRDS